MIERFIEWFRDFERREKISDKKEMFSPRMEPFVPRLRLLLATMAGSMVGLQSSIP